MLTEMLSSFDHMNSLETGKQSNMYVSCNLITADIKMYLPFCLLLLSTCCCLLLTLTVFGPHSGPGIMTGMVPSMHALSPRAIASSVACWRLRATCAAITRCLSAMRLHFAQVHSLYLQWRLCPFNQLTIPWLRQRAHLGFRAPFSVTG